jgi:hypothetical protein
MVNRCSTRVVDILSDLPVRSKIGHNFPNSILCVQLCLVMHAIYCTVPSGVTSASYKVIHANLVTFVCNFCKLLYRSYDLVITVIFLNTMGGRCLFHY